MSFNNPQRDPLDELLASARWPEPDSDRLSRLEQAWVEQQFAQLELRSARRLSRVAIRLIGIAAALLLAVGIVWWSSRGKDDLPVTRERSKIAKNETAPTSIEWPKPLPSDKAAFVSLANSRPATILEIAAFRAWEAERRADIWEQDAVVESAIAAVREDMLNDDRLVAVAAKPLFARRAFCERKLLENVLYFDGSRRVAALKLLGHVGTQRVIGELSVLVNEAREKQLVSATLLQITPPEKLAMLARRERNPAIRSAMLSAMLIDGDERSVGAFLRSTTHGLTRPTALQLVAGAETLPTATLIGWLRSSNAQQSAAAATVLAYANDPDAIEAVVAIAGKPGAPASAFVALVGSNQIAARVFVDAAQHSGLVSAVNEAQYQWRVLAASL
jgi:hypothetical protein